MLWVIQCHAVSHAMLYCAVLYHAVLCSVMLRQAVSSNVHDVMDTLACDTLAQPDTAHLYNKL